eukprot:UN02667
MGLHGSARTGQAELSRPVDALSRSIYVRGEVDWQTGELIYISTTSLTDGEAEGMRITAVSYLEESNETEISILNPTRYYHEALNVEGVDIRARVIMTSRNVRFKSKQQYDTPTDGVFAGGISHGFLVTVEHKEFCDHMICYSHHGKITFKNVKTIWIKWRITGHASIFNSIGRTRWNAYN